MITELKNNMICENTVLDILQKLGDFASYKINAQILSLDATYSQFCIFVLVINGLILALNYCNRMTNG